MTSAATYTGKSERIHIERINGCLLYTSDAADERSSVDLGGRRIIKKKKNTKHAVDTEHLTLSTTTAKHTTTTSAV